MKKLINFLTPIIKERKNVRLGCRYLAALIAEYGLEGGLAGYNGGVTQARRLLRGSSELHPETAQYVPEV